MKEAVKHTRRVGELIYMARRYDERLGSSLMIAMVLADDRDTYVIPMLSRACVLEVRGGLVVEGSEANPQGRGMKNIKADVYPQR